MDKPQSTGGHARAAKLSPEERSSIASIAAQARWGKPPARVDPELRFLTLAMPLLDGMTPEGRERVLAYIRAKWPAG